MGTPFGSLQWNAGATAQALTGTAVKVINSTDALSSYSKGGDDSIIDDKANNRLLLLQGTFRIDLNLTCTHDGATGDLAVQLRKNGVPPTKGAAGKVTFGAAGSTINMSISTIIVVAAADCIQIQIPGTGTGGSGGQGTGNPPVMQTLAPLELWASVSVGQNFTLTTSEITVTRVDVP